MMLSSNRKPRLNRTAVSVDVAESRLHDVIAENKATSMETQ